MSLELVTIGFYVAYGLEGLALVLLSLNLISQIKEFIEKKRNFRGSK